MTVGRKESGAITLPHSRNPSYPQSNTFSDGVGKAAATSSSHKLGLDGSRTQLSSFKIKQIDKRAEDKGGSDSEGGSKLVVMKPTLQ